MRPLFPWLLFFASLSCARSYAPGSANWAEQGFYFDWNNDTNPLPTPITAQCETIDIKWGRGAGTGPDPAAPYIFKIYTSQYLNPFTIAAGSGLSASLPIPFDPGTEYVLCMTDATGVSGGCQDLYTVYPSGNTSCHNVTVPAETLSVNMTSMDTGGLLSRYGWPASCSDLEFNMLNGTPPYTLTVAPAFRTPVNLTFDSSVKWTVVLDHGHPFFVSITDSKGIGWTNGPLHAGAGSLECFNPPVKATWTSVPVTLGMSFSFLILGFLLASLGAWFLNRRRAIHFSNGIQPYVDPTLSRDSKSSAYIREDQESRDLTSRPSGAVRRRPTPNLHIRRPSHNRASSSNMMLMHDRSGSGNGNGNGVDLASSPTDDAGSAPHSQQNFPEGRSKSPPEGFAQRPGNLTRLNSSGSGQNLMNQPRMSVDHAPENRASTPNPPNQPNHSRQGSMHDVYVVHHDAGLPPPVTVFTRPGTRVTELPPGYDNLIPQPYQPNSSGGDDISHRREQKQAASVSASRSLPSQPTLPTGTTETTTGMGLANAEDLPPSAISPTTSNRFQSAGNAT